MTLLKLMTTHQHWFAVEPAERLPAYQVLESLFRDNDVRQFLQVNRFRDIVWFNKEGFDQLLWGLLMLAVLERGPGALQQDVPLQVVLLERARILQVLRRAEEQSEFQVEKLLAAVKS
jgi:hypothetical protein